MNEQFQATYIYFFLEQLSDMFSFLLIKDLCVRLSLICQEGYISLKTLRWSKSVCGPAQKSWGA